MRSARLGSLDVSCLGLGCMGMSQSYGPPEDRDETESIATGHRPLDLGSTFTATADPYAAAATRDRSGRRLPGRRAEPGLARKFGCLPAPEPGRGAPPGMTA